jgi:hypothetical protein
VIAFAQDFDRSGMVRGETPRRLNARPRRADARRWLMKHRVDRLYYPINTVKAGDETSSPATARSGAGPLAIARTSGLELQLGAAPMTLGKGRVATGALQIQPSPNVGGDASGESAVGASTRRDVTAGETAHSEVAQLVEQDASKAWCRSARSIRALGAKSRSGAHRTPLQPAARNSLAGSGGVVVRRQPHGSAHDAAQRAWAPRRHGGDRDRSGSRVSARTAPCFNLGPADAWRVAGSPAARTLAYSAGRTAAGFSLSV